jgi:hypothetical protein
VTDTDCSSLQDSASGVAMPPRYVTTAITRPFAGEPNGWFTACSPAEILEIGAVDFEGNPTAEVAIPRLAASLPAD